MDHRVKPGDDEVLLWRMLSYPPLEGRGIAFGFLPRRGELDSERDSQLGGIRWKIFEPAFPTFPIHVPLTHGMTLSKSFLLHWRRYCVGWRAVATWPSLARPKNRCCASFCG